VPQWEGWHE